MSAQRGAWATAVPAVPETTKATLMVVRARIVGPPMRTLTTPVSHCGSGLHCECRKARRSALAAWPCGARGLPGLWSTAYPSLRWQDGDELMAKIATAAEVLAPDAPKLEVGKERP